MLSELSLSEQAKCAAAWAAKLEARAIALLTTLDAPADPAGFTPLGQPYPAGASISLPTLEPTA